MKRAAKQTLAVVAAFSFIFSGLVSQPASAAVPTLTSVSPSLGTVSGGTSFTLTGTGFTGATGVSVGGVAATDFVVVSDTSITAKTPLRAGTARKIGKYPIVVQHADGNSTEAVYFDYSPDLETANIVVGSGSAGREILGDLASRTEGKPILRNASTPPLTVTGTDSVTGESYSYIFERRSSSDFTVARAYSREGIESTSTNLTTGWQTTSYSGRSNIIELSSNGTCTEPQPRDDYYCTVFGPDVFTQAFYAEPGQSISFDWAASDASDAFEIYAFLVSVNDLTTIPTPSTANHTVATHAQGGLTSWRTVSTEIPAAGYWRFRLVNGSYDQTGGEAIGARFYVAPAVATGLNNAIDFGPFGDWVVGSTSGATQNITVSATSDAKVTVTSIDTAICTVDSGTHNSGTGVTTYVLTRTGTATGECQLKASQGSVGQYAPASDVFSAFTIRTVAVVPPSAPFISSLEPSDGAITVKFVPPSRDGGSPITNYEYELDGSGTWIALNPASTATNFTISGLTNGTSYDVVIRAKNSIGVSTDSNMVSATPNVPAAPVIADYSATLVQNAFGTVSAPTNSGGTITTWLISPTLPAGLSFNISTGVITGSASAVLSATTYTVTATNSSNISDTAILTLTVVDANPPAISYTTPLTLTVGQLGTASPTNTGGGSSSWAITSGTLPAGVTLNSTTGVISGTPTIAAAAVSITITATNPNGSGSATISIEVVEAPSGPPTYTGPILISINPSPLVAGQVQTATLIGERLGTLENLKVNGKSIQIISRTEDRIVISVPETLAGTYDLVAAYSGNGTLTAQQFMRFVSGTNSFPLKPSTRVVITGFRPGISEPTDFQTSRLKAALAKVDKKIVGLTCVGFTNGPRIMPDDPRVALERGRFICDYMKELLPGVPQKLTFRNTTRPSVHWRRAEVYFVTE